MINKLVYNVFEILYRSQYVRCIVSMLGRMYFFYEYRAVSKCIKENKNKTLIAINAFSIYQFNHILPLYQELVKDPSYAVILIGSNPKKIQLPEYRDFMGKNHLVLNKDVISYIWLPILHPDIYIDTAITPCHQLCCSKTVSILFAHSVASLGFSKNQAHIKDTVTYDYILSTGPYQRRALELAAKRYKVKLPKIIPGGFIRGDILSGKVQTFDRRDFKKRCGLQDKNTVLFAPTWGEFSATVSWIDPLAAVCEELDCNLLVKLHPIMLTGKTEWETAGIDWPAKLAQLNRNKNIHICSRFVIEEYMLGSDIMITDVSSVGMEYMFLGKPVIFLPAPQFFNIFGRDRPAFWVRNGLEVADISGLRDRLKTIDSQSDNLPEYDIHNISYNPGKTVESICVFLREECTLKAAA